MRLDNEFAAYLERVARDVPFTPPLDVPARRARMETIQQRFPAPQDSVDRSDHAVKAAGREIPVRVYRGAPGTAPAIVFLHGGGWVAGSVATHDGTCAALAQIARVVVISVEYRRAPEHPFPHPNDDAFAALEWTRANASALDLDPARIGVGGDSAGAHLAAGVTLEARERGIPVAFQLLVYPVVEPDFDSGSYREHAVSATLTRADMMEYWRHYLGDALDTRDARAVPSRAATLTGLPPAHVVVAELDPLRDEGVRYAGLLRAAGVPVTLVEAGRLAHGFMRGAPYAIAARDALRALAVATGRALGTLA